MLPASTCASDVEAQPDNRAQLTNTIPITRNIIDLHPSRWTTPRRRVQAKGSSNADPLPPSPPTWSHHLAGRLGAGRRSGLEILVLLWRALGVLGALALLVQGVSVLDAAPVVAAGYFGAALGATGRVATTCNVLADPETGGSTASFHSTGSVWKRSTSRPRNGRDRSAAHRSKGSWGHSSFKAQTRAS